MCHSSQKMGGLSIPTRACGSGDAIRRFFSWWIEEGGIKVVLERECGRVSEKTLEGSQGPLLSSAAQQKVVLPWNSGGARLGVSLNSRSLTFLNGENNPSGSLGEKDEKNIMPEQCTVNSVNSVHSFIQQTSNAFYALDTVVVLGYISNKAKLPALLELLVVMAVKEACGLPWSPVLTQGGDPATQRGGRHAPSVLSALCWHLLEVQATRVCPPLSKTKYY